MTSKGGREDRLEVSCPAYGLADARARTHRLCVFRCGIREPGRVRRAILEWKRQTNKQSTLLPLSQQLRPKLYITKKEAQRKCVPSRVSVHGHVVVVVVRRAPVLVRPERVRRERDEQRDLLGRWATRAGRRLAGQQASSALLGWRQLHVEGEPVAWWGWARVRELSTQQGRRGSYISSDQGRSALKPGQRREPPAVRSICRLQGASPRRRGARELLRLLGDLWPVGEGEARLRRRSRRET